MMNTIMTIVSNIAKVTLIASLLVITYGIMLIVMFDGGCIETYIEMSKAGIIALASVAAIIGMKLGKIYYNSEEL